MGDTSKTIQLGKEGLIKASGGKTGSGRGDGIDTSYVGSSRAAGSGGKKSRAGREYNIGGGKGLKVTAGLGGGRGKKKGSVARSRGGSRPAPPRRP
jgi:hypothetical protein